MIYQPFIIEDCCCEEFIQLVSSTEDSPTIDPELCVQLLQYLDRHFQQTLHYYTASVMLARPHKYHRHIPIKGIESSFCLSMRQHAWIPVSGGKLLKPGDVYLLQRSTPTYIFRRYVPHLDDSKVTLNNPNFIYDILGIKSQVEHRTMFELFMKWSCNLDSESLWNLVNQTHISDM